MDFLRKPGRKLTRQMTDHFQKNVYEFHEGSIDDIEMLGIKGANLCEMKRY